MPAKPKVVILVRVSTKKQEVQRQIDDLTAVADTNCWNVVAVEKETVRGGTKLHARSSLRTIMAMAEAGEIDKVLVHEISRVARRNSVLHSFVECLTEHKVSLYWHMQKIETLLESGRKNAAAGIMLALLGEMAAAEIEFLSERIKSGIRRAKKEGKKIGRKEGSGKSPEDYLKKYPKVVSALKKGRLNNREIAAKYAGISLRTVARVKSTMQELGQL